MGPPCPSFLTRQVLHSLAAGRSLRPYLPREGRNDALAVTGASPQPGTLLGQPGRAQDPPPASSVEAPQPELCACEDPGALFSLLTPVLAWYVLFLILSFREFGTKTPEFRCRVYHRLLL